MLNQCLESLVQKVQSGVVINFEKTGPDPPVVGDGEWHTNWTQNNNPAANMACFMDTLKNTLC